MEVLQGYSKQIARREQEGKEEIGQEEGASRSKAAICEMYRTVLLAEEIGTSNARLQTYLNFTRPLP